jgi:glycosidase
MEERTEMTMHKCQRNLMLAVLLLCGISAQAQKALKITQIDPPNWFATMPKPLLLVRGEGLHDAAFSLSDSNLQIEKTTVSANGHWAELWLSASPAQPKTVTLSVKHGDEKIDVPYTFAARHPATDGFAGFSSRDVMYLIMTDRFADGDLHNDGADAKSSATSVEAALERAKPRGWHGGDLRGVEQHLDYIQHLGATAVWITPVYRNHDEPDSYHGYGATELYQVDEHYGSLADLQSLAAALHKRGMKLVLDTVPNHVGPKNPWVNDEPQPNWFHGTKANHLKAETNYQALISPHAPDRDRVATLEGWFADVLPDMDTDDPTVAQYLRQNAVWWIEETGADALRIDTFPYVNREFWHDFNGELKQLYPDLTEVGEVFVGDPEVTSSFAGGVTRTGVDTNLTTPFDFPTYFALRNVFAKGEPMTKLAEVLTSDNLFPHPEALVPFFGNHDTKRFMDEVPGDESARTATQRLAFAYVMTTRGMPQIYSGDELAMHGGEDPDNRRDFPGGFVSTNGDTADAFVASGRTPEQEQMVRWMTGLSTVRREHAALGCGAEQVLASDADSIVYERDTAHGVHCGASSSRVLIAIHRGTKPATLNVPIAQTWLAGCQLAAPEFAATGTTATLQGNTLKLQLQPNDVLIASCR